MTPNCSPAGSPLWWKHCISVYGVIQIKIIGGLEWKKFIFYVQEILVAVKWLKDMQKKILPANEFQIKSAGIETHGLNLNAVKVMAEDGVDISSPYSKLIDLNYLNT